MKGTRKERKKTRQLVVRQYAIDYIIYYLRYGIINVIIDWEGVGIKDPYVLKDDRYKGRRLTTNFHQKWNKIHAKLQKKY